MLLQSNLCSDELVDQLFALDPAGKITKSQLREGLSHILQKREDDFAEKRARRAEAKEYERKVSAPLLDLLAKDPRSAQMAQEFAAQRSRILQRKPKPWPAPPDSFRPKDALHFPPFDSQLSGISDGATMATTVDPSIGFMQIGDNVTVNRVDSGYVYFGHAVRNDQDRQLTFGCTFTVDYSLDLLSLFGSTAHADASLSLQIWQLIYTSPFISVIAQQGTHLFNDSTGWSEHHTSSWSGDITVLPITFFAQQGNRYICWAGCDQKQDGGTNANSTAVTRIWLKSWML